MPDDHIKRCDVRVPIDLYNEIEEIAVQEYNAPVYHKTGKPQVSSTIIELLKLGIENLKGEASGSIPDTLSDRVRELESQIKQIQSDTLSDSKPDTDIDEKIEKAIDYAMPKAIGYAMPKAIAVLKSDEEFLRAIALEVQKISTVVADNDLRPLENVSGQAKAEEDEETKTTTQVDRDSIAPIFEEIEESKPDRLISLKEAFAIAKKRGYRSSQTAFVQSFRDNEAEKLFGISKMRARGKYIDTLESDLSSRFTPSTPARP
ncbi:MAG TPA: hypothetical protein V6C71_09980 [Coleofasciculaceae cyanobacterium]|jgi:hypothetical protein